MAEITINGYALPDEKLLPYSKTKSDIHSSTSGRGETGVMNITYVRSGVRKLDIELKYITDEEYELLNTALATKPQTVVIKGVSGEDESFTAYNSDIIEENSLTCGGTRYYCVSFSLTEL